MYFGTASESLHSATTASVVSYTHRRLINHTIQTEARAKLPESLSYERTHLELKLKLTPLTSSVTVLTCKEQTPDFSLNGV
jgi:hypothetical protein